jgi:predicted O-linked N-acetylglucosamine transferase (SPINDLY family)
MNSQELAQYIDRTDGMGKSWLLVQLRLKKLEEQKSELSIEEYTSRLEDIYQDMMNLGEWWLGIEAEVF